MKVVILGPAHPLRGGIAKYNHRLAEQFIAEGHHCSLVSFSLQYPSILFPGTSQTTTEPPPPGLHIRSLLNSVNPLSWIKVGRLLKAEKPDLLVVRFWLPFMGPALGTIIRLAKRNGHTKVVCIADNIIPHEKRLGDAPFTRYFLKACDAFIVMSEKVMQDLRTFEPARPATFVPHPLYDSFGEPLPRAEALKKLGLLPEAKVILFFGFIRRYKGLDLLLKAMADARIKAEGIRLLVAGEFYENDEIYKQLIADNHLEDAVILHTNFIPDSEVAQYFSAADCVVQPYRNATQSGVTPLAYHFEKPMIVTNVGGLPAMVPHGKAGLVAEPNERAIADAILAFYGLGAGHFLPGLIEEKQKFAWSHLTTAILSH